MLDILVVARTDGLYFYVAPVSGAGSEHPVGLRLLLRDAQESIDGSVAGREEVECRE